MDIVTRLKMFLEQAGISNSQFADTCDIPRPTLSQLLNGRNKKVSDEVIGKIHRAYPSLNIMWLMFGDGEMLSNGADPMSVVNGMNGAGIINNESREDDKGQRAISFEDDSSMSYRGSGSKQSQRVPNPTSMSSAALESMMRSASANAVGRSSKRNGSGDDDRHVVNIFVFYSDGRFERFEPA